MYENTKPFSANPSVKIQIQPWKKLSQIIQINQKSPSNLKLVDKKDSELFVMNQGIGTDDLGPLPSCEMILPANLNEAQSPAYAAFLQL